MTIESILDWQTKQWQSLTTMFEQNHLSPALLLMGAEGLGKRQFAKAFSAFVLCQSNTGTKAPCGHCRSCAWLNAGFHPDEMVVEPLEGDQSIKIDAIRAVVDTLHETSIQGGWRVLIIDRAHTLNVNAANALLKTLEEAPARTLFMLITHQVQRMPATIRNRCQKIVFSKPERSDALKWLSNHSSSDEWALLLDLSDGAPLAALRLLKDNNLALRKMIYEGWLALRALQANPLKLAVEWQQADVLLILKFLLSALRDLLRLCVTGMNTDIINHDYHAGFLKTAKTLSTKDVLHFIDLIQEAHRALLMSPSLNKSLLLEELLIRWRGYPDVSR